MPNRTRRANKRAAGTWKNDPYVPISGERMRAALQHSGLGLADLARKLGEARQTLDYIVRGATKRCRRSRRAAIARALAVPDAWLAGSGAGGMDWLLGRLGGKRQSHLAINRLARRCEVALQRDGSPVPNATGLLLRLALPSYWRTVLMDDVPADLLESDLEQDIAQTALANAFEAILQPWFTGEARLDYGAVRRLNA